MTNSRTSLVTGGTGGIGAAVAIQLAAGGDRVLITGRDGERGAAVLKELHRIAPGLDHALIQADLSLLRETERLAAAVAAKTDRLDAIVLCAGILATVPEWTDEGQERTFVLNYLSRFVLIRKLVSLLTAAQSGRIVLVANAGKYDDTLDLDDLQYRHGKSGLRLAGGTQFANDLLAVELAHRLRDTAIEVTCVYPGMVATDVFRNARGVNGAVRLLALGMQRIVAATPEEAAHTPVYLAQNAAATGINGQFFGPKLSSITVPDRALRKDRRDALWAASEALTAELTRTFPA